MEAWEGESTPTKKYWNASIEENPQRLYARQHMLLKI